MKEWIIARAIFMGISLKAYVLRKIEKLSLL